MESERTKESTEKVIWLIETLDESVALAATTIMSEHCRLSAKASGISYAVLKEWFRVSERRVETSILKAISEKSGAVVSQLCDGSLEIMGESL
jgi:hypothetical protein